MASLILHKPSYSALLLLCCTLLSVLLPSVYTHDHGHNIIHDDHYLESTSEQSKPPSSFNHIRTFLLDESAANHTLLRQLLSEHGYSEISRAPKFAVKDGKVVSTKGGGHKSVADFVWTFDLDRVALAPHSSVNHFSNCMEMTTKSGLLKNLKRYYADNEHILNNFSPRAYEFQDLEDRQRFFEDYKQTALIGSASASSSPIDVLEVAAMTPQSYIDGTRNIWIAKPGTQARGVGIRVFDNLEKLVQYGEEAAIAKTGGLVVQKYIEKPLLLSGNRKFDIRQFVLIESLSPLTIFVCEEFYLRLSAQEFTFDELDNRVQHLTNYQVQKTVVDASVDLTMSKQEFIRNLQEISGDEHIFESKIRPAMIAAIVNTLKAWPNGGHRANSYEVVGFDLMLDDRMHVWMIEANNSPGLYMTTEVVKQHHRGMLTDLVQLLVEERPRIPRSEKACEGIEQCNNYRVGKWQMVYQDASTIGQQQTTQATASNAGSDEPLSIEELAAAFSRKKKFTTKKKN